METDAKITLTSTDYELLDDSVNKILLSLPFGEYTSVSVSVKPKLIKGEDELNEQVRFIVVSGITDKTVDAFTKVDIPHLVKISIRF